MDPDKALATIKSCIEQYWGNDRYLVYSDVTDLVEAIEALDGWLSCGGFPPKSWSAAQTKEDMENIRAELMRYPFIASVLTINETMREQRDAWKARYEELAKLARPQEDK